MSTTLQLKRRPISNVVNFPLETIREILQSGDREVLWSYCQPILDNDLAMHDKRWLEMIIDWIPPSGQSLSGSAKWFKLAARVAELDTSKESDFTLSDHQSQLLWTRMNSPDFKVDSLPAAFVGFVMDFQKATGRHFEEEEPDDKPVKS